MYSCMLVYIGFISLLHVGHTEARRKRNAHRRHNNHLDWSGWTEWSSCTAQCGTGAAYRERHCIDRRMRAYSNKCHGKRHQFKICNTQDCTQGQETLREQLCSKHNNDVIGGKRYRWLPYLLHSARCELTCKAGGQGFYNSFKDLIINGTTCSNDGSSVCVEGVCHKFGCDGIVGSKVTKDICGVCDGDGSTCKMVQDVYEDDKLKYGYNLVTIIPSGATAINVTQLRIGRNYLALKLKNGQYIINGHRRLSAPGQYEGAGTTFTYKNRASKHCPGECLLADGPTNEDLEVMLLYFGRNTGVLYKFGYPIDRNGMLKYQDLSLANGNSGNSIRIEGGEKRQSSTTNYLSNGFSDRNNRNYDDNGNNDYYNAVLGNSGNRNTQSNGHPDRRGNTDSNRNQDRNRNTDSNRNPVRNRNQDRNRNQERNRNQDRNRNTDPNRNADWNRNRDRNTNRNDGTRNRYTNNRGLPQTERYDATVVIEESQRRPDRNQPKDKMEKSYYISSISGGKNLPIPAYTQSFPFMDKMKDKMHKNGILANGQNDPMYQKTGALSDNGRKPIIVSDPLDPQTAPVIYNWRVIGYTDCNRTCGSGIQHPIVKCVRASKEVLETHCRRLPRPDENPRDCNTQGCPASWEASPWTSCSTTCDDGMQIRNISCLKEVADSLFLESTLDECSHLDAPKTFRHCKVEDCFKWSSDQWSECSTNCGEGLKTRTVNCTSADGNIVNDIYCNSTDIPPEEEGCYSTTCEEYEYSAAWYSTSWEEQCPVTCGVSKQRRRVVCVSENPSGPDCEEGRKPEDERECRARQNCNGYWFSGPWLQCNSTCGEGTRSRQVLCLRENGNTAYEVIPNSYCDMDERPVEHEICKSSSCPPEWFMTEWSQCSVTCGKGERSRDVLCIDTDNREVNACDITMKPSNSEECGTNPCNSYTDPSERCEDTYPNCPLVIQAGMCKHKGYRAVCCQSCLSHN
ncbi:thrombospondin type-1 domain-containing protein 4-like isoform X2 [Mytilus edulis]|uniref:thrombospondin type-1 domain-containing protein 4-like isoform X2 n=1 Tax=Mytilus edulis TaxID=6550 RepID=UPI0039EE19DB